MTTNMPFDEITTKLEEAQEKDPNIKIKPIIQDSVQFLDITIANNHGTLRTTIYHKPSADPYYLPYISDHPHRIHRNIAYSALVRAARLCSNLYDFHFERLRIQVSLLLNNYPPKIITNQFLRFFQVNKADLLIKRFDEHAYEELHQKILYQPTKRQIEKNKNKSDPVSFPPILQPKSYNSQIMYVKYGFESGPNLKFCHEFFNWWQNHYKYPGSPANRIQICFLPQSNRTLQNLLIHKKPPRQLLKQIDTTTS